MEKLGLTVHEAAALSSLGQTSIYKAIREGRLRIRKQSMSELKVSPLVFAAIASPYRRIESALCAPDWLAAGTVSGSRAF